MKEAIQKAIEGGWRMEEKPFIDKSEKNWVTVGFHNVSKSVLIWHHEMFLDPLFWQSLGKALEWDMHSYFEHFNEGYYVRRWPNEWQYRWHSFIDHLAEGKDAESFFTRLLSPEA